MGLGEPTGRRTGNTGSDKQPRGRPAKAAGLRGLMGCPPTWGVLAGTLLTASPCLPPITAFLSLGTVDTSGRIIVHGGHCPVCWGMFGRTPGLSSVAPVPWGHDHRMCLQTLPKVPKGARSVPSSLWKTIGLLLPNYYRPERQEPSKGPSPGSRIL